MESQTNTNKVDEMAKPPSFRQQLTDIINRHSKENNSDTPDWILAVYLEKSLEAFDHATNLRTEWYSPKDDCQVSNDMTKEDAVMKVDILKTLLQDKEIETADIRNENRDGKWIWVLYVNELERMNTETDSIKELQKMVDESTWNFLKGKKSK